MTRVKRGTSVKKRHKKLIQQVKGFRLRNKNVFSRAKNAWMKAGVNEYIGRKKKKRDFRRLWNIRINTAAKENGMSYSTFIHSLFLKRVTLNRKVLSNIAITHPTVFKKVVDFVK